MLRSDLSPAGRASLATSTTSALLGSYGVSFRTAPGPLAALRLDVGRRFSDHDKLRGYSLSRDQMGPGFVSFYFGYNY